jgi:hypothetical protein
MITSKWKQRLREVFRKYDIPPIWARVSDDEHNGQQVEGKGISEHELTWLSMRAVRGRKSKRSVKNRHTLAFPYLRRHSS